MRRGKGTSRQAIVLALAEALGVTPNEFLDDDQADERPKRKPRK